MRGKGERRPLNKKKRQKKKKKGKGRRKRRGAAASEGLHRPNVSFLFC